MPAAEPEKQEEPSIMELKEEAKPVRPVFNVQKSRLGMTDKGSMKKDKRRKFLLPLFLLRSRTSVNLQ